MIVNKYAAFDRVLFGIGHLICQAILPGGGGLQLQLGVPLGVGIELVPFPHQCFLRFAVLVRNLIQADDTVAAHRFLIERLRLKSARIVSPTR